MATVFPLEIGLAASIDPERIEQVADVISTDGRAKYHELRRRGDHDIYKGLTLWFPNVRERSRCRTLIYCLSY